jgi:hypothetical protein
MEMITTKYLMRNPKARKPLSAGYWYKAVASLALMAFLMWPVTARAQEYPSAQPPPSVANQPAVAQEDPSNVARLSVAVAESYVLGKDDVDWSIAEPNLIIEQGDLLQTNETGKAEIQFEPGMTFRMGEATRIAVVEMGDNKVVGIDSGKAYLRLAKDLPQGKSFVLTFPAGEVIAVHEALVRVNVLENGDAEVKVIRGRVGIETKSESAKLVGTGEKVMVTSKGWIEYTEYDVASRDDFDAWNEERDIALSAYDTPKELKKDLVGAEDLKGYGEWVQSDKYGQSAWKPYVAEDWRPYYYGRWYYSGYYGWTWIPVEPWGYVTYHYGSWNYDPYYGWVWVPDYVWRPHYVQWVMYDPYIGWAPIGYYGYPVITTYPYYVTNFHTGFFDVFSFTFVFFDDFHHHHVHHHFGHHGFHGDTFVDIDKNINVNIDKDVNVTRGGVGREHLKDDHERLHKDYPKVRDDYMRVREDYRTVRDKIQDRKPAEIVAERLKNAKGRPQFVKNLNEQGFFKDKDFRKALRKGSLDRGSVDAQKLFALDKNPELRKRIAKLEKNDFRFASQKGDSPVSLPKKLNKDQVKALDFRKLDNKGKGDAVAAVRKQMQSRSGSPRSIVADNRDLRDVAGGRADQVRTLRSNREDRSRIINQLREGRTSRVDTAQLNREQTERAVRQQQAERVREAVRSNEGVRERAAERGIDREQLRSRIADQQRQRSDVNQQQPRPVDREQLRSIGQDRGRAADTERFREQMRSLDREQLRERADAVRSRIEERGGPGTVDRIRQQDNRGSNPQPRLERLPRSSLNRGRDIPHMSQNSFREAPPAQAPQLRSQSDNSGRFDRMPEPARVGRSGSMGRSEQRFDRAPRVDRMPNMDRAPRVERAPNIDRAPRMQQRFDDARIQSAPQIRGGGGHDFSDSRGRDIGRGGIRSNRGNRR